MANSLDAAGQAAKAVDSTWIARVTACLQSACVAQAQQFRQSQLNQSLNPDQQAQFVKIRHIAQDLVNYGKMFAWAMACDPQIDPASASLTDTQIVNRIQVYFPLYADSGFGVIQ